MTTVDREILEQVVDAAAEPVMIVRLDHNDWPVVLANAACRDIGSKDPVDQPFAEVIEALVGREIALEISETFRSRQETAIPVETGGSEYLLSLKPLSMPGEAGARCYAVFWRGSLSRATPGPDARQELMRAKRRIRDLTREDPVSGLLNDRAFREILEHDWAVASREKSTLALVLFSLDDFDDYVDVFGRHASDSCIRRVGRAIRRCLRRASDVVGALDGSRLIVLSHASDEDGVRDFAKKISLSVRELGLHHPRSSKGKFVTVSHFFAVTTAGRRYRNAAAFLDAVRDMESGAG